MARCPRARWIPASLTRHPWSARVEKSHPSPSVVTNQGREISELVSTRRLVKFPGRWLPRKLCVRGTHCTWRTWRLQGSRLFSLLRINAFYWNARVQGFYRFLSGWRILFSTFRSKERDELIILWTFFFFPPRFVRYLNTNWSVSTIFYRGILGKIFNLRE